MKKSIGALLITALVTTALTGCAEKVEEPTQQEQPSDTTKEQTPQQDTKTGDPTKKAPSQEATEESHKEIREAYNLDGYITVTPMMLTAIAMGKIEDLALDQKASLSLAKAISAAMSESGWKQGDLPPGIFLEPDGTSFAIGLKTATGDLLLHTYMLQADGTWKKTKDESKPGKK